MATWNSGTVNNITYSSGSTWNATRTITAGDGVIAFIKWEGNYTLSSVSDNASTPGTWLIAVQRTYSGQPGPGAAIAYCLSHPGGTNVTVTATFSATADAILEMNLLTFTPATGKTFELDGTPTSAEGNNNSFSCGDITTTGAGFAVQWLGGYQLCSGVVAGGTPTFTKDTATENGSGTTFGQYYISSTGQTISPAASWGALGAKYVFMAAAFKEVDAGGGGYTITASGGSYTLTGSNVALNGGYRLIAASGTYTVTGADAFRDFSMAAQQGTFTFTGSSAALRKGYALAASGGSFTETGAAASLKIGRKIIAETGSFVFTGSAASLIYSGTTYTLSAEAGSFSETGANVALTAQRRMVASPGTYTFTGFDATFVKTNTYRITADSGAYTYTGRSANLVYSGAPEERNGYMVNAITIRIGI